MKSLLLVANFKSNKTSAEAKTWIEEFSNNFKPNDSCEVVVCPSFTSLLFLKQYINEQNLPIKLGAQDVSSFSEGAYTGEVNAKQVKELADFVIIGHSERRNNFGENDEILENKVSQAMANGLKVIFCVQDQNQEIPQGVEIVAYEPIFAIGTGNADSPENTQFVARELKKRAPKVLYGGSVNEENIREFTSLPEVDGVLVGGASLDAKEFSKLVESA
jgi:triosephosphate isomerase (TIM)